MDAWSGEYTNQKHTAVDYTQRYLYSLLDEDMRFVYRKIDEAVRNLESEVFFDTDIAYTILDDIYFMYMHDNPELFYLGNRVAYLQKNGQYGYLFFYSDGVNSGAEVEGMPGITDELRESIRSKQAKFNAEVEKIISKIPADAPDIIKERMIYDHILKESKFNSDAVWNGEAPDDWTAYGVMIHKQGVCESYSEAFQTLCYAVGINCTPVVGEANGKHKWNAVLLDGQWYMCDITFDDPVGGAEGATRHDYFNLTTAEFEQREHVIDNKKLPVPVCTATKYSYANYFGED